MRRLIPVTFLAALAIAGCSSSGENTGTTAGSGRSTMPQQEGMANSQIGRGQMTPIEAARQELTTTVGDRVYFDTDSTALTDPDRTTLDRQIAWLNRYPMVRLVIEGHADERGTREFNLALGDRRAQTVKNYLTDHGIAAGRLRTISYGKERPVAMGSNEAAWAQNRRAVSVVDNN